MPYGYTKNAQGHLIKALEPDIMDTVIRSAASDTLSAQEGRKVLSVIDRDILRKKFANWESKKDTSITDALKQLIFKLEGREKGGPVNSGQAYIVGEKGPEIFVPRNSGGIIPNTSISAPPQGLVLGGGVLAQTALPAGMAIGAQMISQKVANPIAAMIIQQIGFILPMIMMNSMMMNKMQGGAKTGGIMSKIPASMTTPIGVVSSKTGGLTKYGAGLDKMASSGKTLPTMLSKIGFAATRLNVGLALLTTAVLVGKNRFDAYKESMRLNALGFGMTAEGAEKAGLKFTDYNKKIKDAISDAKALRETNRLLFESRANSGTSLNITVEEFKKLKKESKELFKDQIALINKTSADDQVDLAIRLKQQFIAMGMSAEEATKKIYAMYAVSNFSSSAAEYTVASKGFNSIKTSIDAAVGALRTFNDAVEDELDPTEQANAFNTALLATEAAIKEAEDKAMKAREKEGAQGKKLKFISQSEREDISFAAEQEALNKITSTVGSQKELGEELVEELKKQNPELDKLVNKYDTNLSVFQKLRIVAKGFTGDLSKLNAAQTNAVYQLQTAITNNVAIENRNGMLKKQYDSVDRLRRLQDKYETAAKGQRVSQQISDRDKLSALQKQIDANNKLADARIKALTAAKEENDLGREIAKKKAEYDAALATGDVSGAQILGMDIQGLESQMQFNSQVKAIENARDQANAPLIKQIDAMQKKQQALADAAALAGEKLGDVSKAIDKQESAIDKVNSTMADYRLQLQIHKDDLAKWKDSPEAQALLTSIAAAAEAAKVDLKNLGIEKNAAGKYDAKSGQQLFDKISGSLEASLLRDGLIVNGDVIINGKKIDISGASSSKATEANPAMVAGKTTGSGAAGDPKKYYDSAGNPISEKEYKSMPVGAPSDGKEFVAPIVGLNNREFANRPAATREFFELNDGKGKFETMDGFEFMADGRVIKNKKTVGSWFAALPGSAKVKSYYEGSTGGVKGPGTGTSDSIPAYLSNGEYVLRASAVSQYGVPFLDALNAERLHKGGPVHPHRSDGSHEVSMSAMTPEKQAASNKAMDKLYEKNPDYYKNKNGEWTKKGPSQWEKYTTASNWLGLFQNGGGTGAISDDIQSKLLTIMFGPNASKMNSTGKDFKKGEWATGALNLLTAGLTGTVSTAFGRAFIEQLGVSKGIPGIGTLLPKGSFPFAGAAGSKVVQNAIPAIMIGTARPFMDSLSPVISSSANRTAAVSQQATPSGQVDQISQSVNQSVSPGQASRIAIQNQINEAAKIATEQGRFAPRITFKGNIGTISDNPRFLFTENLDGNVDDILNWPWSPAIKRDSADKFANQNPRYWENVHVPKEVETLSYKQKKAIAMLAGVKVPIGRPFPKITQAQLDSGYDWFYKNEDLVSQWGDWSAYRDATLTSVGLRAPATNKSRFVPWDEAQALTATLADVKLKNADGTDSYAFKYSVGSPESDPRWSTAYGSKQSVIQGGAGDRGALMLSGDLGEALRRQYGIVYEDLIKTGFIRRARIDKNGKRIEDQDLAPLPYSPTADKVMGTALTLDEFLLRVANELPGVTTSARHLNGTDQPLATRPSPFVQALNESYVKNVLGMGVEDKFRFTKYEIFGSPLVDEFGNPKAGGYYSLDEGFDYAKNPGSSGWRSPIEKNKLWGDTKLTKGKFTMDLLPREFPSPVFAGGGFTDEMAIIVPEWLALEKSKHVAKHQVEHFTNPMSADYGRFMHASRYYQPTKGWTVDDAAAQSGGAFGFDKSNLGTLADLLNTGKVKTRILNDGGYGAEVKPWTEDDLWNLVQRRSKDAIIKEGNSRRINPDWLQSIQGSNYEPLENILQIEEIINLVRKHILNQPEIKMLEPRVSTSPSMTITVPKPRMADGGYVNPTYSANMSIPKFDSGINNVPADMLAMIHKNEAVVPAHMNPFNPNANNATMGGSTFNITNNINGFDGDINQLSRMVTQQTVSAIKSLDGRSASMVGPNMNVSIG
jgi:hypothetical protein